MDGRGTDNPVRKGLSFWETGLAVTAANMWQQSGVWLMWDVSVSSAEQRDGGGQQYDRRMMSSGESEGDGGSV